MLKVWCNLRWYSKTAVSVVLAGCLVGLGFLSNACSQATCENRVARWIASDVVGGKTFQLYYRLDESGPPPCPSREDSLRIFRRAGARVIPFEVEQSGLEGYAIPYAGVGPGRSRIPFVVNVEYCWQLASLNGFGGYRRSVTIFGITLYHWDKPEWVS